MNQLVSLAQLSFCAFVITLVSGCDESMSDFKETKRKELKAQKEHFEETLATLEDQNQQLIQMLEEAEAKLYSQTNELESLTSRLSAVESERDQSKQRASELEDRTAKIRSMMVELEEAIQANTEALQQNVARIIEFMPRD